jgi:hypothetical protein
MSATTKTRAPRRERSRFWLIVGGCLLLIIGGQGIFLLLPTREERHLREVVAELDRDDPGWRLEDIEAARAVVPDKENSARVVVAAGKRLPRTWPPEELGRHFDDHSPAEQLPPEAFARLKAELDKVEPALSVARTLAHLPHGRHHIEYAANPIATILVDQAHARVVATLLVYDARRQTEEGDLKAALVSCRAALNAGRSLGDEPSLVSQLIRITCVEASCREVERVLAQGEPPADELAGLQELLADEEKHPALLVGLRGERAFLHKTFEAIKAGEVSLDQLLTMRGKTGKYNWFDKLAREDVNVEHARVLSLMTRRVRDAQLPPHRQAAGERAFEAEVRALPPQAIVTRLILPETTSIARRDRNRRAHLCCLISAIACERHRQAEGSWPCALAELVPEYLSSVPTDPYDGKPLRLARLADGLVVYSVGPDGSDDGGKLNRRKALQPGTDLGFRLWDVASRRQPPPAKADPMHPIPPRSERRGHLP